MYQILSKKVLNPNVTQMEIKAPLVARKAKPGQFIILSNDNGPLLGVSVGELLRH